MARCEPWGRRLVEEIHGGGVVGVRKRGGVVVWEVPGRRENTTVELDLSCPVRGMGFGHQSWRYHVTEVAVDRWTGGRGAVACTSQTGVGEPQVAAGWSRCGGRVHLAGGFCWGKTRGGAGGAGAGLIVLLLLFVVVVVCAAGEGVGGV